MHKDFTEKTNLDDDQHCSRLGNLDPFKLELPCSVPKNSPNICLASDPAANYCNHRHHSSLFNKTSTESHPVHLTAWGNVPKSTRFESKHRDSVLRTSSNQQIALHSPNEEHGFYSHLLNSTDFLCPTRNRKNHPNLHNFPLKNTPSGNIEFSSSQVVYATKELSVLVPDPKKTTVRIISNSRCMNPYKSPNKIANMYSNLSKHHTTKEIEKEQVEAEELTPASSLLTHRSEPHSYTNNKAEALCLESTNKYISNNDILKPEISLTNFTNLNSTKINWDKIDMPKKKNLFFELHERITHLINPDCVVTIDNTEFKCHLIVLQCYSELFDAYEAIKKIELSAKNCSTASFAFIYKWMICKEPSYTELTQNNVLDIYIAASYLRIPDLIEQCWSFIDNVEVFQEETAFLLYLEAKKRDQPIIKELMIPRIKQFFLVLVGSSDWPNLDLADVKAFLKSNYIAINCEMEIFMSGVRWLLHDWTNRMQYKREVMECVYFENVAPWQLIDIKRNRKNPEFVELAEDPAIAKMIDDGMAYIIIKYWYKQEHEDLKHWKNILALREPQARNWNGPDKIYYTYSEFLNYLEHYTTSYVSKMNKTHKQTCSEENGNHIDHRSNYCKKEEDITSSASAPAVPITVEQLVSKKKSIRPKKIKPAIS